jgi:hypothetical protein
MDHLKKLGLGLLFALFLGASVSLVIGLCYLALGQGGTIPQIIVISILSSIVIYWFGHEILKDWRRSR